MRAFVLLLFCIAPLAAGAQSLSQRLAALAPGEWLGYDVPLQPGQPAPCCFDWKQAGVRDVACRLDRAEWNFGHRDGDPLPEPGARLRVLVRQGASGPDRVRAVGAACAIDPRGATVVDAGSVDGPQSLSLIGPLLERDGTEQRHHLLGAVALHAGPEADALLGRAAASDRPRSLRRDAYFWLAQARGEPGFRAVRDALHGEGSGELRRHLVFALSISRQGEAVQELRRLATTHADGRVRGEAMFWLSQNDDPQAEAIITRALATETSRAVQDKAVFALSQLPAERAVPALRALLESDRDRHLRKQALFWLAQVDDDAVLPVFDRLLGGAQR